MPRNPSPIRLQAGSESFHSRVVVRSLDHTVAILSVNGMVLLPYVLVQLAGYFYPA